MNGDRPAIVELIAKTARLLDDEKFDAWLALFADNAVYEFGAYSPEIRQTMSWWKADAAMLALQLKSVGQHVRDPAQRRHLLGSPGIVLDGDRARAETTFAIYRTTPAGQSSLYMVGRYDDVLVRIGSDWRYASHRAIADTRMLDAFTHVPV